MIPSHGWSWERAKQNAALQQFHNQPPPHLNEKFSVSRPSQNPLSFASHSTPCIDLLSPCLGRPGWMSKITASSERKKKIFPGLTRTFVDQEIFNLLENRKIIQSDKQLPVPSLLYISFEICKCKLSRCQGSFSICER